MRKNRVIGKITKDIARRVKALRESHGVSQTDLAAKLGLTQSHWAQMEKGNHPFDAETLHTIADAFGASVIELLFDPGGYEPGTKFSVAVFGKDFTNAWKDHRFKRLVQALAKSYKAKQDRWIFEACARVAQL
jgi:transcriptional regulator with XRE-family HTH domain